MTHNARYFVDGGHLRQGCTLEEARDVLWAYTSPELYERLVLRQGWPLCQEEEANRACQACVQRGVGCASLKCQAEGA